MNALLLAMTLLAQPEPRVPPPDAPVSVPSLDGTSDAELAVMAFRFMKQAVNSDSWERWAAAAALLLFVLAFRRRLLDLPQKYMRILGLSAAAVPGIVVHLNDPTMPLDKALGASFAIWLMAVGGWAGVVKLGAELWADLRVWLLAKGVLRQTPQDGGQKPDGPTNGS